MVIGEVDRREQDRAEHLVGLDEVVEIGARIVARGGAGTRLVDRARVVGVARVLEVDRPEAGEGEPVPAVARRQDAVEHVDAACHRLDDVLGCADPHEIARPLGRERGGHGLDDAQHHLLRLAHGQPADGITVKAHLGENTSALCAQSQIVTALHDGE